MLPWKRNCVFLFIVALYLRMSLLTRHTPVLRVKCPIFLSNFNQIWIFSRYFQKSYQYQISRKSVKGSRYLTCGQTDKTKLKDTFRDYANEPKNCLITRKYVRHFKYYMTVSVLLPYVTGMQSACAVLHCNMGPVWLYHFFFHIIS